MTDRLRRSWLYTPADDPEMMRKAAGLDSADAVIFDLEDSIPDDAVATGRENVADVVDSTDFGGIEVCVRINGLRTDRWRPDLEAAVEAGVHTVVLPMVESADDLDSVVSVGSDADGPMPEFVATVETPRGVFDAPDIADRGGELDPVTAFSYGLGDYTNAVGATGTPDRLHDFLTERVVSAAAMGGLDPIASVYQDFKDTEGLREQARDAREIGFVGQKAIHPSQLDVLNEMYTPTREETERARRFVDAFEESDRDSIVVDGVFLDTPIVEQYQTILDRHAEVSE